MTPYTNNKVGTTACLLTTVFAGCSNSGSTAPQAAPSAPDKTANAAKGSAITEPVSIEFWHSMSGARGELFHKMVEGLNKSQSLITVKDIYQGSYFDLTAKLQAAVASGNSPEAVQLEILRLGQYAEAGALVDITPYVKRDQVDTNDFIPGLMNYSYL